MTSVALLIAVAAITPGPNNLIVMRAAARLGFRGALPPIVAIVLGGLAMLTLVMAGAGAVLATLPQARALIALLGAAYLCWLGFGLMRTAAVASDEAATHAVMPLRCAGLFGFQFLNPKGWVMVLTVFAAMSGGEHSAAAWWSLLALYTVIPAVCLSLWSALGAWLTARLTRPAVRAAFDRAMGLLLIGSALTLALEVLLTNHGIP